MTADFPRIAIITSCSSTRLTPPIVKVADMPTGLSMQEGLKWWVNALNSVPRDKLVKPRVQYQGLGFFQLAKIHERFPIVSTHIITGGQGLIDIDEPIAPYDFIASPKYPSNVTLHVTTEPFVHTVWWRGINALRNKGSSPIATLINSDNVDVVIFACSKNFLKYVSEDILTAQHRDKVKILLSASSMGSVVAQIRARVVAFDRQHLADVPGNRNDVHQRALFTFLDAAEKNPAILTADIQEAQKVFSNSTKDSAPQIDIEALLRGNSAYMEMEPEEAYKLVRRQHGTIGGRMFFYGIFRKVQGVSIEVDKDDVDAAKEALEGLSFVQKPTQASTTNDDASLQSIKTFVLAVGSLPTEVIFNAADILSWAQKFYRGKIIIPSVYDSVNKLAFFVRDNASILGLEKVTKAGSSGSYYRVKKDVDE